MSEAFCLGAIVAVVLILAAHFAWRRWKQGRAQLRARFSYLTPAAPTICEAAEDLFGALSDALALGRSFEATAAAATFPSGVRGAVSGARQSVALVTGALAATEWRLRSSVGAPKAAGPLSGCAGAPSSQPTYANYHAIYRGLCGADALFLNAAAGYIDAGRAVHSAMAGSAGAALCDANTADAGATLINLGKRLHGVVRAIHRLGVALDLE